MCHAVNPPPFMAPRAPLQNSQPENTFNGNNRPSTPRAMTEYLKSAKNREISFTPYKDNTVKSSNNPVQVELTHSLKKNLLEYSDALSDLLRGKRGNPRLRQQSEPIKADSSPLRSPSLVLAIERKMSRNNTDNIKIIYPNLASHSLDKIKTLEEEIGELNNDLRLIGRSLARYEITSEEKEKTLHYLKNDLNNNFLKNYKSNILSSSYIVKQPADFLSRFV
jgi:hypothetical protein